MENRPAFARPDDSSRKPRPSGAAFHGPPDGNPEDPGLVAEVVLNPGAGKYQDPDRERREHGVVALEGRRLGVSLPIRLERDLRDLSGVGPAGGDEFGAGRSPAVQERHVAMSGVELVELVPDQRVVVVVGTAGQGDPGTRGQRHFVLGSALGGEIIAAVDHRRGQRPVVDLGSRSRSPEGTGVAFVVEGGLVAKELHRVAALDGALPFAGEPLEFDGADFRAVLFLLPALLRLLVGVEVTFDPVDGAVEEIDRGPEEVVEVGLEARVRQRRNEGVKNVGDRAGGERGVPAGA